MKVLVIIEIDPKWINFISMWKGMTWQERLQKSVGKGLGDRGKVLEIKEVNKNA